MPRLIWVFAGRTLILLVFFMAWLTSCLISVFNLDTLSLFVRFLFVFKFLFALFWISHGSSAGKELFSWFSACVVLLYGVLIMFVFFCRLVCWVGRWMISVPDRCLSNYCEIMALFVLRKLILQTRMRSHPVGLDVCVLVGPFVPEFWSDASSHSVGLDVWFLVGPFVFHTSCVRKAKALARLCECAGSPSPSLVTYVISTIIS